MAARRDQFWLDKEGFKIKNRARSHADTTPPPLSATQCPVCYDVLPKETWSNYVEGETVELYDRYNSASRVLSRFCAHPKCGAEVPIVPHLMEDEKSTPGFFS